MGGRARRIRRSGGNITAPDVPTFQETNDTSAPKFSGELPNTDFDQVNGSFGLGYSAQSWEVSTEFTHWQNQHNFLLPNGKGLGQYLQNDMLTLEGTYKPGNNWILTPEFTYTRNLRQSSPGGGIAIPREDLTDDNLGLDILQKTQATADWKSSIPLLVRSPDRSAWSTSMTTRKPMAPNLWFLPAPWITCRPLSMTMLNLTA
ncbi:MAG: hypothetical protein U5K69_26275 [Balneolaceae bacterium]|nr:hypothetical protein [Balneolaceae bacterium]